MGFTPAGLCQFRLGQFHLGQFLPGRLRLGQARLGEEHLGRLFLRLWSPEQSVVATSFPGRQMPGSVLLRPSSPRRRLRGPNRRTRDGRSLLLLRPGLDWRPPRPARCSPLSRSTAPPPAIRSPQSRRCCKSRPTSRGLSSTATGKRQSFEPVKSASGLPSLRLEWWLGNGLLRTVPCEFPRMLRSSSVCRKARRSFASKMVSRSFTRMIGPLTRERHSRPSKAVEAMSPSTVWCGQATAGQSGSKNTVTQSSIHLTKSCGLRVLQLM